MDILYVFLSRIAMLNKFKFTFEINENAIRWKAVFYQKKSQLDIYFWGSIFNIF